MRRLILCGLLAAFLLMAVSLSAAGQADDLSALLPADRSHPFLHFTADQLPALRERVKTEPRAGAVYERILKECDRLLEMPVSREVPPRAVPISPYYIRQGDPQDNYRHELSKNAFDLAFIYQMTGEEKYARKSYEFAEAVAVLDSWVDNWDKFQWLYWMGKPFGAKWNEEEDNEIVYSYDLGAAHASRHLAATYDWLYPALTDYQRKRLRKALLENAVLRVKGNYDYQWWAHAWRTNWLPVCFSGIGLAALAMYPEDPEMVEVVEEVKNRIERFFKESIGQDGGYQEGVGYWRYGMENAVLFATVLKNVSQNRVDMFDNPLLETTIQFPLYTFVPPQGSVPFADSYATLKPERAVYSHGNYALYQKLAEEFNSSAAKWLGELFFDFDVSKRPHDFDLYSTIWPAANVDPAVPSSQESHSKHFRTIDWVIMRASWENQSHPVLATKGGIHDDPHHGHLDSGQIAIAYQGEWYVKELGYMQPNGLGFWDYRRRFRDYPHANSLGHNVIFVNGEEQQYGPEYFGKVLDFRTDDAQDYTVIDSTKAYPGRELKAWQRHVVYKKPYFFIVLDEVQAAEGSEIRARIHPGVPFELNPDHVFMRGESGRMLALPLLPQAFQLQQDRHPILAEGERAVFHWVPYYDLVTEAQENRTYIVNLFVPTHDNEEAERILASSEARIQTNRLVVKIKYRGADYETVFDLSGDVAQLEE